MTSDLYAPRHPLSEEAVTIEGRRLKSVSILRASLTSAIAFLTALAVIATLTFSAGFDDGGNRAHTGDDLARELVLVIERIETLSTAIDNGDIEGMHSPAGATVQMLLDRRTELVKQLSNLPAGE